MATVKTGIALDRDMLALAEKAAAAQGLSVSAFLSSLVREHAAQAARFQAMDDYLQRFAPWFRLSDKARAAIEAEWSAPLNPRGAPASSGCGPRPPRRRC